jgi:hypothetical protein
MSEPSFLSVAQRDRRKERRCPEGATERCERDFLRLASCVGNSNAIPPEALSREAMDLTTVQMPFATVAYWMPLPRLLLVTVLRLASGMPAFAKRVRGVPLDMSRKHSEFPTQNLLIRGWPPRSSSDKSLRRKKTKKTTTDLKMKR